MKVKKLFTLLMFSIFFLGANISFVSSECEDNQVDINTASLEELDEIYGIGEVKAQAIIDYRENEGLFSDLDNLVNVNGIGEKTLENIKSQGLACVDEEESNESENLDNEEVEEIEDEKEDEKDDDNDTENIVFSEVIERESEEEVNEREPIILNPKDIKSESNVNFDKNKYSIYGFITFCTLLIFLFLLKKLGEKNEFR